MIMAYKEKLKKELHLISVDERLKCYLLTKKVWLMFWEENIQKKQHGRNFTQNRNVFF